jgi:hypothetical protein
MMQDVARAVGLTPVEVLAVVREAVMPRVAVTLLDPDRHCSIHAFMVHFLRGAEDELSAEPLVRAWLLEHLCVVLPTLFIWRGGCERHLLHCAFLLRREIAQSSAMALNWAIVPSVPGGSC